MSALKPDAVDTHELGTTALPWKNLHIDAVTIGARSTGANVPTGSEVVIGSSDKLTANPSVPVNVEIYGSLTVHGNTTTITTADLQVTDKTILVNDGGAAASAAGAGLLIEEDGSTTGYLRVDTEDRANLELKAPSGSELKLDVNADSTFTIGAGLTIENASVLNQDLTTDAAVTFGSVTADGGLSVDNFTLDGTSLALSAGDFTLDVAGDINLDADGDDITFKAGDGDATGLKWSQSNSGDWTNLVGAQDKDLIFQVNDGGVATEVMRLDGDVSSLLMAGTKKIEFGDAGSYIHQSADGKLAISSDGAAADAVVIASSNAAGGIDIDAGTAGIAIDSTGALSIDAAAASNISVATGSDEEDLTIEVTGATNSSLVLASSGTAADALTISTSAGGMDITVAGAAAGEDLDLTSNTSINITAAEDADDAVVISGSGGGVTIDAGGDSPLELNASGAAINIGNDAVAQPINIGTGNSARTVTIGHTSSTEVALIATTLDLDAGSAFTIDGGAASTLTTSDGAISVSGKGGVNLQIDGDNVIAIDGSKDVLFSQTGGTTGNPDVEFDGYVKFDGSSEFDGAVQVDGALTANNTVSVQNTLTVGANTDGHDVKLFGNSDGQYLLWDESADELVLAGDSKLSFHDAAGGENIVASSDGHLEVNAGTTLDMSSQTVDINATSSVTVDSPSIAASSSVALSPVLELKNTAGDADGARLKFVKEKGAAGAQGDDAGVIQFFAGNATQTSVEFARITAEVQTATNLEEGGKLSLSVAEHDGTMTPGLVLTEGSTDGVVDVAIGAGLGSTTTIAGNLTVNGTTTTVNSTTVQVDDKNIELGVGSADDTAADGGGITLKSGDGDKTFNWVNGTSSWTSSEDLDLADGKHFSIAGTTVLDASGASKVQVGVAGAGLGHADGVLTLNIDELAALGGTGVDQADHFVFSDGGTEKKITFSNLEDAIFGNVSGDATVAAGGALTIAAGAVEGSMLNTNAISGQAEMTGDVADADELMISDDGVLKRADFSVVRDAVFNDVSGDATVAAGGALTIAAGAVEHGMLNDNIISGQSELAHENIADADDLMIHDSDAGVVKKVGVDSLRDHYFGAISGDALVADGGALTIQENAVENSMILNDHITLAADSGANVDLDLGDTFTISGTAGEIETSVTADTITIGLPDNVDIDGTLTVASTTTLNGSVVVDTNGGATFRLRDVAGGSNKFVVAANGDTTITGKLTVSGVLESDGTNLEVKDALVQIGSTGVGAFVDTGIYSTLSTNENLGLIWDRSDSRFKLYESLDDPDSEEFTFSSGSASTLELGQVYLNDSAEDAGNLQATPLTTHATYYVTDAAETSTLAAGSEGQVKVLAMKSDGGDMVVTVTNPAWGGSGTVTLSAQGQACTLQYIDSKWYCIGNNGCAFA